MEGKGRQYRMEPDVFRALAYTDDSGSFDNLTDPSSTFLQVTTGKNTVLHVALQFKNFEAAKKIVGLSPSLVYETNSKGNTPLHVAAREGNFSMVKELIDHAKKLDVETGGRQLLNMVNLDGDTVLHVAVRYDNFDEFEIVKELMKEDPLLAKDVNKAGESALFLAVDRENYKMASHILGNAPDDCSLAGRHGMNVLHALVLHTSSYINKGDLISPREMKTYGKESRLGRAFMTCVWVSNMLFLYPLRDSPDSNSPDKMFDRKTAPKFGTIPEDFVREVMRKWPSTIEQGDDSGWTPLHIAAHMDNREFVKLLLENGNSPAYVRNKEGLSALHIAAKQGNDKLISVLMEECPDMYELLDNNGRNALHVAAEIRAWNAVLCLGGAWPATFERLVNEQDFEGNTPMHIADLSILFTVVRERGRLLDLNATNKEGLTIMDKVLSAVKLEHWYESKPLWTIGSRPSLRGALIRMGIILDPKSNPEPAGDDDGDGNGNGDGERRYPTDFMKRVSETNLLVATLIATVTFTAAFTVPGGYNQNGSVNEGLAVLSKRTAFGVFLVANTIAFGLSTTSVFVHFLASATIPGVVFFREVLRRTTLFTHWSVGAMLVAFIAGTYTVVPHSFGIAVAVILCCCFLSSMLLPLSIKKF